MLSPSLSSSAPEGAHLQPTSPRRRALSYLRHLSQNRTSSSSSQPEQPRPSAFSRSATSSEPRPRAGSSTASSNQSQVPVTQSWTDESLGRTSSPQEVPGQARGLSPALDTLRADTTANEASNSDDQGSENMARQRQSSRRHASVSARTATNTATTTTTTISSPSNTTTTTPVPDSATRTASSGAEPARAISATGDADKDEADKPGQLPTIRFFPHHEVRSNGRQSLNFAPISRTLPREHSIIRVGRYSEREGIPTANPTAPSDAPVGFKSKVVSRKHCEFSFLSGQWHIKDVASSSGTFLNHIRLSQPNTESRQFPIKDGDIVQLGIDFRGGEEMIFRCVKIRIECNRAWQKKPNTFNKSRHVQLQMLGKDQTAATGTTNNNECSICLGAVLPCQSLFVAPCAHVWHYKCIRPLLEGKNSIYPQFQCPNCRAYADLSADVDIAESDMEEWMVNSDNAAAADTSTFGALASPPERRSESQPSTTNESGAMITPTHSEESAEEAPPGSRTAADVGGLLSRRQATSTGSNNAESAFDRLEISSNATPNSSRANAVPSEDHDHQPTRVDGSRRNNSGEGPLTPRNNAGPFVFDGGAGRGETAATAAAASQTVE